MIRVIAATAGFFDAVLAKAGIFTFQTTISFPCQRAVTSVTPGSHFKPVLVVADGHVVSHSFLVMIHGVLAVFAVRRVLALDALIEHIHWRLAANATSGKRGSSVVCFAVLSTPLHDVLRMEIDLLEQESAIILVRSHTDANQLGRPVDSTHLADL